MSCLISSFWSIVRKVSCVYESSALFWRRWNQMMTHWVKMSPIELSWTANNQLNVPFQKLISFLLISSVANNHFIPEVLVLKTSNSRLNQARNGWPDSTTDTFPDTPLCSSISAPILLLFQPLIHFYLFLHINWRLFNFALVPTSNFPPLPVSCLWVIALDSEHCPTKNFSSLNFKRKSFEGQYDFRAKMLHLKQKKITLNCFGGDQHDYCLVLSSIKVYCVGNNGGARYCIITLRHTGFLWFWSCALNVKGKDFAQL